MDLFAVAVSPKYRGKNLVIEMFKESENIAKERNLKYISMIAISYEVSRKAEHFGFEKREGVLYKKFPERVKSYTTPLVQELFQKFKNNGMEPQIVFYIKSI